MTIVEALKKLYTKLGGAATDVDTVATNAEIIDAIAELDVGGGGGAEPFVIDITYSSGAYTTDKTVSEINQAVANGIDNIIIAFHDKDASDSGTVRYLKDFSVHEASGNKVLSVCSVIAISDVSIKIIWLTINQGSQTVFYRRVDYGISGGDITPTYTQIPG